jgi:dTDP-glucose pyrophosphorylase/CBS domain-containing protein
MINPAILVHCHSPLRQVMSAIDQGACGIALLVDDRGRLLATLTDGDVRRGVLSGLTMDAPASELLHRKGNAGGAKPITARFGAPQAGLLALMRQHTIHQIPLLDEDDRPVDLAVIDDLLRPTRLPLAAIIMAGGFGTRLAPLTDSVPKPMLPVGGRPMLHHIVNQLREAGIQRVIIATHYLPDMIESYFGRGDQFGLEIQFVHEHQPLGTAGALGLIDTPQVPFLVINGDVLTDVNYRAMWDFHLEHQADLTVAARSTEFQIPYGILQCSGVEVRDIREKPTQSLLISAGIYLLNPSVHAAIPRDTRLDMPELIERMIGQGSAVVSFPVLEYWLDIGRHAEYRQAEEDVRNGSVKSAPSPRPLHPMAAVG